MKSSCVCCFWLNKKKKAKKENIMFNRLASKGPGTGNTVHWCRKWEASTRRSITSTFRMPSLKVWWTGATHCPSYRAQKNTKGSCGCSWMAGCDFLASGSSQQNIAQGVPSSLWVTADLAQPLLKTSFHFVTWSMRSRRACYVYSLHSHNFWAAP